MAGDELSAVFCIDRSDAPIVSHMMVRSTLPVSLLESRSLRKPDT